MNSANNENKRNIIFNRNKDGLNNSNYIKSGSLKRKLLDHSNTRDDSRTIKNESLISNSFLQKRQFK